MKHDQLIRDLRKAAEEIAEEGHDGWGNTCAFAADDIEKLVGALGQARFFIQELGPTGIDKDLTLRVIDGVLPRSQPQKEQDDGR